MWGVEWEWEESGASRQASPCQHQELARTAPPACLEEEGGRRSSPEGNGEACQAVDQPPVSILSPHEVRAGQAVPDEEEEERWGVEQVRRCHQGLLDPPWNLHGSGLFGAGEFQRLQSAPSRVYYWETTPFSPCCGC